MNKKTPLRLGLATFLVLSLAACGGGGGSAGDADLPKLAVVLSSTLTEATVSRVAQVATSGGATATTTPRAGATLAVPPASASPLVLATDAQGRLVLATLASENELSAANTAVALLWMWIKPVAGIALDDKTFASTARRAAGFDMLVMHIDAALAAGASPVDSLPVLTTLGDMAAALGDFAKPQSARMRPLAEIAQPRLAASAQLLKIGQGSNNISGNIFVKDTGNLSVFNGTALYWSAYTQAFDGKRGDPEADLLSPVSVADAIRYTGGVPPTSGYALVQGHPSVSYDLVVLQDPAARRANAVMLLRTALEALLGTTALRFGDVSCLNDFVGAVAPAELDALVANVDADAIQAYLSAYQIAVANITLGSLTVSASCGGGQTILESLTKHMALIQGGLRVYNDGFAKLAEAKKVGTAIGTWIGLAVDIAGLGPEELKLGVCVADGRVVTCAKRYALKDNRPWLEGASAVLPLVAFDADPGGKETLVPSTLTISSQNVLPFTAGKETVVQVLSADFTTILRIRDEPTGHDSSTVTLLVEPGKIQYVSLLGSATTGPFNVDQTRALAVMSSSDASPFYGDVGFDWRLATGSEAIVKLSVLGGRLASVKALQPGEATVQAFNAVTKRKLEFRVVVDGPSDQHWAGRFKSTSCTPLPADAYGPWIWENPCNTDGPYWQSFTGYFYFDDSSPDVVLGTTNSLNPGLSFAEVVRRVFPLGWRSSDTTFMFEVPTAIRLTTAGSPGNPSGRVSHDGSRKTVFTVISRDSTSMSGTFITTTVSGYYVDFTSSFGAWRTVQTQSTGTWSASLVVGKRPQTTMYGFDFCSVNNVAANQMADDGNSGYLMPLGSNIGGNIGDGNSVPNGCQFN